MPGVSVACGHAHTVAIGAEEGDLWAWGAGDFAQLGLNSREHKALPARVGGREVFAGCRVAQVACGACHTAAVASDGALWMWGEGGGGRLGTGDTAVRLAPTRLGPESFGHAPVARVACGAWHTVAATTAGAVWGFGDNSEQQLGVCGGAGRRSCLWPTRVSEEQFGPGGTAIVELAAQDVAREMAEDFIDQRGPCKPADATDGMSTAGRRSSRINGAATTDGFRTQAKRAAGGFFKEILCQLSPGCVYTKLHHNKKVADKLVVCTCRGAAGVKACSRDLVTFEHGYVIKTDKPSRFFELKGVWADPATALEFGSMYLCCKNCNSAADKAGATNIQMCLYQDLVEARAALADQAP